MSPDVANSEPNAELGDILALCGELIRIDKRRKEIDAEDKALIQERAGFEGKIINAIENGADFQGCKMGGQTVYMSTDYWPKVKQTKPLLITALKQTGLEEFVKEDFNTQSLRGYTNELIRVALEALPPEARPLFDANNALPDGLKPFIELSPDHHIKTRKSAS